MERKSFAVAEVKADPQSKGEFSALVSVYNNVDSVGDRVLDGFFDDALAKGFPAVVWSHNWGTVPIGATMAAKSVYDVETWDGRKIDGLQVDGKLLIEDHATAREVWAAMKTLGGDGRPPLRQFSFAYEVAEAKTVDDDDFEPIGPGHVRDLVKAKDVFEVGPTLLGANQETMPLAVKSIRESISKDDVFRLLGVEKSDQPAEKAVVPYKETTPVDGPWDAAAEKAKADLDDLRAMAAYVDGDPKERSSYRFLHHRADAGHPVVWRGVRGAMRALLSDEKIDGRDRGRIYEHLAAHYAQFEKDPPELRSYGTDEIKSLFPEPVAPDPVRLAELLTAEPFDVVRSA